LVLSHLSPKQSAEIMSNLPPERQLSVVRRIATMGQTSPEIIQEVERALEHRMSSIMSQQFEKAGGVETAAAILNVIDRSTEKNLLENLGQDDPELVEEIRRLMFVFDDIVKFSDRDIQTVLKNVENSQWAMALKGAPGELRDKILRNMSKRAAALLQEEMEFLGPVRQSSVQQVQQQIVDIIRRLEDTGEITRSAGDEEEAFVQ
jgi:flagellar motor switch protein FliG